MMSCTLTTLEWAQERLANTERIAMTLKAGADRESWLEDMAYWMAIVAELTARRWQPISTAPRDGTLILARQGDGVPFVARWTPVPFGGYFRGDGDADGVLPTLWMAIPLANTEAVK